MADNECPDSRDITYAFFQMNPPEAEYRSDQVDRESITSTDIFCDNDTSFSLSQDMPHGHNKRRKDSPTSSSSSSQFVTTPLLELFHMGKHQEVIRNPLLPKRRIRRVNNNPFPRILKSDIRRSLAVMYANVMNSGDMEMVASFFRTFCVDHCETVHKINDILLSPWGFSYYGLSSLKKHMQALSAIPDMIVSLDGSSIQHSLHESGSKVLIQVLKRWTAMDETYVEFLNRDGQLNRVPLDIFDIFLEDKVVKEEETLCKHVMNVGARELSLYLWVVCYMDNNNRIYKMEFQGQLDRKQRIL